MKKTILMAFIFLSAIFILGCKPVIRPEEDLIGQMSNITSEPEDFQKLLDVSAGIQGQPSPVKIIFINKTSEWFVKNAETLDIENDNFSSFEKFESAKQSVLWNWTGADVKEYSEELLKDKSYEWVQSRIIMIKPDDESLPIIQNVWRFQKTAVYENNIFDAVKKNQRSLLKNQTIEWAKKRIAEINPEERGAIYKINSLSSALESDFLKDMLSDQVWIGYQIQNLTSQAGRREQFTLFVNITKPEEGAFIKYKTPVNFVYNSTYGIKLVRIYFGNKLVDTDTSPIYQWTIYPDEYIPGIYNLTIAAYDNAENNFSDSITVILPGEKCGNSRCDYDYYENCQVCLEDCKCYAGICSPGSLGANTTGCLLD